MIGDLSNHLWQSTVFALVVALLTAAFRNNRAQIRYGLWLSASLKFLIPFSLLMGLGSHVSSAPAVQKIAASSISSTMVEMSRPFPETLVLARSAQGPRDWVPAAILVVWACGFSGVMLMRVRGWLRIRAAIRASTPLDIPSIVTVRSSPGCWNPVWSGCSAPSCSYPRISSNA